MIQAERMRNLREYSVPDCLVDLDVQGTRIFPRIGESCGILDNRFNVNPAEGCLVDTSWEIFVGSPCRGRTAWNGAWCAADFGWDRLMLS